MLSVLHYDGDAGEEGQRTYSSEVASLYMHTVPEITSFFGSFDLVPPGVADTRHWLQEKRQLRFCHAPASASAALPASGNPSEWLMY